MPHKHKAIFHTSSPLDNFKLNNAIHILKTKLNAFNAEH